MSEGAASAILFEDGPVVCSANAFDSRLLGEKVPLAKKMLLVFDVCKRMHKGRKNSQTKPAAVVRVSLCIKKWTGA